MNKMREGDTARKREQFKRPKSPWQSKADYVVLLTTQNRFVTFYEKRLRYSHEAFMTAATHNREVVHDCCWIKVALLQMLSDGWVALASPTLKQPLGHMLAGPDRKWPWCSPNISCSAATVKGVDDGGGQGHRQTILRRGNGNLLCFEKNHRLGCRGESAKHVRQFAF